MSELAARRLLLVHAHPDDESIGTGATMSRYAAEGAAITLVTCTLGELGEVIPPELADLAADADGGSGPSRLGRYRIGELAAACRALGVSDHRFLGGAGRWHDSGMMGTPANAAAGCFWQADVDEAAGELLSVIRDVQPQVLVSYDARGLYGHPDHIQAHRVTRRAFDLAGGLVRKLYATVVPRSQAALAVAVIRDGAAPGAGGDAAVAGALATGTLAFGTPDEEVTTEIDGTAFLAAKLAAMQAHATQITVDGPYFALSSNVRQLASGREYYTLLAGPRGTATARPAANGASGSGGPRETDLFAGVS